MAVEVHRQLDGGTVVDGPQGTDDMSIARKLERGRDAGFRGGQVGKRDVQMKVADVRDGQQCAGVVGQDQPTAPGVGFIGECLAGEVGDLVSVQGLQNLLAGRIGQQMSALMARVSPMTPGSGLPGVSGTRTTTMVGASAPAPRARVPGRLPWWCTTRRRGPRPCAGQHPDLLHKAIESDMISATVSAMSARPSRSRRST